MIVFFRTARKFLVPLVLVSVLNSTQGFADTKVVVIPLFGDSSTWRGHWLSGDNYRVSDIIEEGGSSYIATVNHVADLTNIPPDNGYWELMAASGANGIDGLQGVAGLDGAPGIAGPIGPVGMDGAQGAAGPVGPQGASGLDGAPGVAGATGPQGLTGAAGLDGAQGVAGPAGPQGASGLDGAPGVAGATGATGPQGLPGAAGMDGAQGVAGPVGPQGASGLDGAPGVAGATGAMGPQGLTGAAGLDGAQGVAGPAGPQGASGLTGPQGPVGATGPQGPDGIVPAQLSPALYHHRDVANYKLLGVRSGMVAFVMPKYYSGTILTMEFSGYDLTTDSVWKVTVGALNNPGSLGWYRHSYVIEGNPPFNQVTLTSVSTSAGPRNAVIFGDLTTTWTYTSMVLTDLIVQLSGVTGWDTGWTVELMTSNATVITSESKVVSQVAHIDTDDIKNNSLTRADIAGEIAVYSYNSACNRGSDITLSQSCQYLTQTYNNTLVGYLLGP